MKESKKLDFSKFYVKGYVWGLFPIKHYLQKDEVVMYNWFYKYFKWLFDFVSMMFSAMLEFQGKEQVFIIKYSKESARKMTAYRYMMDNKDILKHVEELIKKTNKVNGKIKQKTTIKKEGK